MNIKDKEYDCPYCGHTQKIGAISVIEESLPKALQSAYVSTKASSSAKSVPGKLFVGAISLFATCVKYKDGIKVTCDNCRKASKLPD